MKDYNHKAVADFITEVNKLTPHQLAKFWEQVQRNFPMLPGPTQNDVLDGMIEQLSGMSEWEVGNSLKGAVDAQQQKGMAVVTHWWSQARKADDRAEKEAVARTGRDVEGVGQAGEGHVSSAN